jgi:hypothetical protein
MLDNQDRRTVYPTYTNVTEYLETIQLFRALQPKTLCGCHWPVLRGEAVFRFLDESEWFVSETDRIVAEKLAQRPHGVTMRELIDVAAGRLGLEKDGSEVCLFIVLSGHLARMTACHQVSTVPDMAPEVFVQTARG